MFWNVGLTKKKSNKLLILASIILSAIILPSFAIKPSLPRIRLDDAVIFGVVGINAIIYLFSMGREKELHIQAPKVRAQKSLNQVFILLTVCAIVSNIYAFFFLNIKFGLRDLMEFVTYLKYYLIASLAVSVNWLDEDLYFLAKVTAVGLGVVFIISLSQFWNIFQVNSWFTPLIAPSHLDNLVNAHPPRILGTFDNPNMMAITSVMFTAFIVSRFYFEHNTLKNNIVLLLIGAGVMKMVFMTISRAGALSLALVLVYLSLRYIWEKRFNKELLLKIGVLFIVTVLLLVTSPHNFTQRMVEATDVQTSTSAQGHFKFWSSAGELIKQSPILGWGTAKTTMTTVVDDEYLLITRRYGLIGLAAYLWFFIKPFIAAWRIGLKGEKGKFAVGLTASILGFLLFNVTAATFYNLQLMAVVSIMMGIIYRLSAEKSQTKLGEV